MLKRGPWKLYGDRLKQKNTGEREEVSLAWPWLKGSADPGAVEWRWGGRSGSHRLKKQVTLKGFVADVHVR